MMMEMPISSGFRNRQADSGPMDWRQLAQWLLDDQVISVQEHQRIVNLIVAGDAEAAAAEMRNHVVIQGDRFHDLVASIRAVDA